MRVTNLLIIIRYKAIRTLLAVTLLLGLFGIAFYAEPISFSVLGPLKQRLVVIDPGHGGIDGGANTTGFLEKDINLAIAKKLKVELQKSGAKVMLTRDKDDSLENLTTRATTRHRRDLLARTEIINQNTPDLFISLHVNASRNRSTTGPMVFYNKRVPRSEHLAKTLQGSVNAAAYKRELKKHLTSHGDYFVLNNTHFPGVILETGFVTNQRERNLLKTETYQQELAEHICQGVRKFFSEKPASAPSGSITVSHPSTGDGLQAYFPQAGEDLLGTEPLNSDRPAGTSEKGSTFALRSAVEHLIRGPETPGLEPVFNPKAELLDITLDQGITTLNFSKNMCLLQQGSEHEFQAISALLETLGQFPQVAGVKVLINGQTEATLGHHMDISKVLIPPQAKAKIAFVIDDLASSEKGLDTMLSLGRPLTMAVMPKAETTRQTAELVFSKGLEVFLHLPMEPDHGKASWLGEGAITSTMLPKDVGKMMLEDLATVPHAVGFNNHMGSKITKREDLMFEVLKVAKAKHLIILDSRTTQETIIPELAERMELPYIYRSVFLDDVNSLAHVKQQIKELAKIAKEKGSAIAIGHVGPSGNNTAQGLKEMIPWLEDQGIELVFASQLVR